MRRCLRCLMPILLLLMPLASEGQVFTSVEVPDSIWDKMQGRSYPRGCGVPRAELRFLQLSHYDFDGNRHVGQMVCNRLIADDLVFIFRELYEARYPIARMRLIDEYKADDLRSSGVIIILQSWNISNILL